MSKNNIEVYKISSDRNYWIVRAGEGSTYYKHFCENNLVALGHADGIDYSGITQYSESGKETLSADDKKAIITKHRSLLLKKKESKRQISNKNGQVKRFLNEIKIDDIVITVNLRKITAGRITSECYYDDTPLSFNAGTDKRSSTCESALRYEVEWGKSYFRKDLPYVIDRVLRNQGAIFSISEKDQVKAINHWLAPIHFSDGEIRCSVNITAQDEISNRELTNLSRVFDQLEILASYLESCSEVDDISVDGFQQYCSENGADYQYSLTAQHAFMSPGHQFVQLPGTYLKQVYFGSAFALLFSSTMAIAGESQSVIPPEKQAKMQLIVQNIIATNAVNKSIKSLKVKLPNQNAALKSDITEQNDNIIDFAEPKPSTKTIL